jgi:hypothetical protein
MNYLKKLVVKKKKKKRIRTQHNQNKKIQTESEINIHLSNTHPTTSEIAPTNRGVATSCNICNTSIPPQAFQIEGAPAQLKPDESM